MTTDCASGKRILIVEDEPDFAALLSSMLSKAGYSVTTAFDGVSAMVQVRNGAPDLITLDIQMPRKSGLYFYRELKSDEAFRDIPIVVVTGLTRGDKDMENTIRSFLEPGHVPPPDSYVEKPVDGPRLLQAVQEAMATSTFGAC